MIQSQAANCKLPIRSEIHNCTFKNRNKVSIIINCLYFILFFLKSWKKLPSLCNFSLFGHENLLFGFQYIHNISLSTFFLVDCGVVNAGILQPEGVEFMLGG